ncbi:MAG: methylenetetrahydrofolate--tRNA-(uracil(54)-C(5))-methyltransferase (FADH(2)-oxidizing) TrmFO [Spirochaetales bacterium]
MNNKIVNVIGAGLAGSEASYQLAKRGIKVNLYEMKPTNFTPAHKNQNFAELVCSNSLRSNDPLNAAGLLKEELRLLDSLVIRVADKVSVPAGSSLAVDRGAFSKAITDELKSNKNITIINEKVNKIDVSVPTIIATGPLTTDELSQNLKELFGQDYLYFFDAIAPIVSDESIDKTKSFFKDRYDKGKNGGDYLNCPMNKAEYDLFYKELISAKTIELKDFENDKVFEGCMPVEVMAKRGEKALLFGPLKPVGLSHPETGEKYYAIVQLRKENTLNELYNLVGFQTNLNFAEQKRVFSLIPALKNAEFVRYGIMHRNTFVNAPAVLNKFYQVKKYSNLFLAGQLSGVEGYIESISSGLYCAINMANHIKNKPFVEFSAKTCMGAMPNYMVNASPTNFQPMNINFGIVEDMGQNIKDKNTRRKLIYERSIAEIKEKIKEGE